MVNPEIIANSVVQVKKLRSKWEVRIRGTKPSVKGPLCFVVYSGRHEDRAKACADILKQIIAGGIARELREAA